MNEILLEMPVWAKSKLNIEFTGTLIGKPDTYNRMLEKNDSFILFKKYESGFEYQFILLKGDNGELNGFVVEKDSKNKTIILVVHVIFSPITHRLPDGIIGYQVKKCHADQKYRRKGFVKDIYFGIVEKAGISVLSDWQQYDGGVHLWKGIARVSRDRKTCKVRMYDTNSKNFIDVGGYSYYDGFNIKDSELWSINDEVSGKSDMRKQNVLLALVKS